MKRRAALLLLSAVAAASAIAQTHPNLEKGFAADKMYQFGDVDHVNLFNGNLTLTVPLGAASPVAGKLSIAPVLVYNSKIWDSGEVLDNSSSQPVRLRKTPTATSNAGLGWQLSFGRLLEGSTNGSLPDHDDDMVTSNGFTYWSPDGGDHHFDASLHGESDPEDKHQYTHDGTYLRLTQVVAEQLCYVESPDGIVREFSSWPDGSRLRWRITKIRDAFGNHLDFDYSTSLQWTVTDQFGRQTLVHFAPVDDGQVFQETPAYRTMIDWVEVPAPSNGPALEERRARYTFSYARTWVDTGYCHNDADAALSDSYQYKIPVLTDVTLPDGSGWHFTYETTGWSDQSRGSCTGGVLRSATLPTRGVISWTFSNYELPTTGCDLDAFSDSAGVNSRHLEDPVNHVEGTWTYAQTLTPETVNSLWQCTGSAKPRDGVPNYAPAEESITTVTDPAGNVTKNYFSVWPGRTPLNGSGRLWGTTYKEDFGLPYTRQFSLSGGKYLSTVSGDADHLRKTYVKYERDLGVASAVNPLDTNRRLVGTATTYADDPNTSVFTDYSEFDGVGHYRKETVSGTSADLTVLQRTTVTDYNRQSALVGANIPDTGNYPGTTFAKPTGDRWLLDLYTRTEVTEGSATATKELCFNPETGFLRGTRTYAGSARAASDLLAAFDSDSTAANRAYGATTGERYYGGDAHPLTMAADAALCDSLSTPGPLEYEVRHTYDHGVRVTSDVYSGGAAFGVKLLDQEIDPWTGLVLHSRDSSGVQTDYGYDISRRVTSTKTAADTEVKYTYANAVSATQPATVTIRQGDETDATAPAAEFRFDGLGRLFLHSSALPPTTPGVFRWSRQATAYDSAGRKQSVSEWQESDAPSHLTVFNGYDAFGRVTSVLKPDNTTVTTSYVGTREVIRTDRVRKSGTVDSEVVTTEYYDIHGRLRKVADEAATTDYTYDVGNHLSSVSMPGGDVTQQRSFVYDNRGFLTDETHPENGKVKYTYDSRGHMLTKRLDSDPTAAQNLTYHYDAAERLVEVDSFDAASGQPVVSKEFAFRIDSTPGWKNKLWKSTRHNYTPNMGDVIVTEAYGYSAAGRVTQKVTEVSSTTTALHQQFTQTYTYDSLGQLQNLKWPDCSGTGFPNCGQRSDFQVSFDHQAAMLTSVNGFAGLEYDGNGMVTKVNHQATSGTGIADSYEVDPTNGMPRPKSIKFETFSGCAAPSITTPPANQQVNAGATATFNVAATGANVTYQWYDDAGKPIGGATNASYTTPALSATHSYSVSVTNACGRVTAGATATVSTCTPPSITSGPQNQQVAYGATASMSVSATGTGLTYQWYDGGVAISGATSSAYTTPALQNTHTYTVTVGSACGSVTSSPATITVSSTPPSLLDAHMNGAGQVVVSWAAGGSGTDHYEIERRNGPGAYVQIGTISQSTTPAYTDAAPANGAYLYRVRGVSVSGVPSAYTNVDLATTVAFTAVATGQGVAALPFNEVLTAVNAILALGGQATVTWASILPSGVPVPGTGALIKAAQLTSLRTTMDSALAGVGIAAVPYTDVPPNGVVFRAVHIQELQNRAR